jgi:protein-S-isoprenylcysteine O-methyltransferase Ste14
MQKLRWVGWYALAAVIVAGIMPGISYAGTVALERAFRVSRWGSLPTNGLLALPIVLFGLAWIAWSASTLRRHGRGHAIHAFGKAPQPTTRLCHLGPYRHTQNPMYFGWLVAMVGVGVALGSIVFVLTVPLAWLPFISFYLPRYEWPDLQRRFGSEWSTWHQRTAVIVPSLRGRHSL